MSERGKSTVQLQIGCEAHSDAGAVEALIGLPPGAASRPTCGSLSALSKGSHAASSRRSSGSRGRPRAAQHGAGVRRTGMAARQTVYGAYRSACQARGGMAMLRQAGLGGGRVWYCWIGGPWPQFEGDYRLGCDGANGSGRPHALAGGTVGPGGMAARWGHPYRPSAGERKIVANNHLPC